MATKTIQWKLRRLGPRAVDVLERHKDASAAIAAFEELLVSANEAYADTYDQLRVLDTSRATKLVEGRKAVMALHKIMRTWVSVVSMSADLEGFKGGSFGRNTGVMDDVIHDAEAFLDFVAEYKDRIAQSETLVATITFALERARKDWIEAQSLRQTHQELVKRNRVHALRLHEVLVAFRKALVLAIGRSSPDYQSLRAGKIEREDVPHVMPDDKGEKAKLELEAEPDVANDGGVEQEAS